MGAQRQHAIVVGGSMAGLLAARALADDVARVTLIDRDTFAATMRMSFGQTQRTAEGARPAP